MKIPDKIKNIWDLKITILISLLPVALIAGTAISNLFILLINIFFIYIIFKNKKTNFLLNKFFIILILIWILLFLNSIFIGNNFDSFIRSFGFIRFILLIFAFKYFFEEDDNFSKNTVFTIWFIIFNIVTIDIFIEFTTGSNIFGIESAYKGRIASFTGEELKIGNYYFGFILLALSFFYNNYFKDKKYFFYLVVLIFMIASFLIGERSNFIKVFIACTIFMFLLDNKDYLKKLLILILSVFIVSIIIINNNYFKQRFVGEIISPIMNKGLLSYVENSNYGKHYEIAKKIHKKNYLFGVGIKNYRLESGKKEYNINYSNFGGDIHPHQIHYEFLAETGLVGYLIFLIFFIFSIFYGFFRFFRDRNLYILSSTLFILTTALPLIPSGSFFTSFTASIFWINYSFLIINIDKSN